MKALNRFKMRIYAIIAIFSNPHVCVYTMSKENPDKSVKGSIQTIGFETGKEFEIAGIMIEAAKKKLASIRLTEDTSRTPATPTITKGAGNERR